MRNRLRLKKQLPVPEPKKRILFKPQTFHLPTDQKNPGSHLQHEMDKYKHLLSAQMCKHLKREIFEYPDL